MWMDQTAIYISLQSRNLNNYVCDTAKMLYCFLAQKKHSKDSPLLYFCRLLTIFHNPSVRYHSDCFKAGVSKDT